MADSPTSRSVKIDQDERGGWSSDRPRPGGGPARPADVAVRGRALAPSNLLRYSPGSLVVVVSGSAEAREALVARVVDDQGSVLSSAKVRALLAGRGIEDDDRAAQILDAAVGKRLTEGNSVTLVADGVTADERERYVRMAAANRRPRHLVLVEAPRDQIAEDDHDELNALRRALDAGTLGGEGFSTFLRLGGSALAELKRLVYRAPQQDD